MDGESQKATQILRPSATKCATALNASFVLLLREGTQNGKYVTLTNAPHKTRGIELQNCSKSMNCRFFSWKVFSKTLQRPEHLQFHTNGRTLQKTYFVFWACLWIGHLSRVTVVSCVRSWPRRLIQATFARSDERATRVSCPSSTICICSSIWVAGKIRFHL